jgi:hypothetical protein
VLEVALIFCEGFDKYGGTNTGSTTVAGLLTAGEWTSSGASTFSIVSPLSAAGQALQIAFNNNVTSLSKTLPASYARLIGGIRISGGLLGNNAGVSFLDAGTAQCSITLNFSTGTISLRNGGVAGTALATSGTSVSANSTHYLEWDITFGNSAAYQVWLDGVSLFSGAGDTTGTANNTANQIALAGTTSGQTVAFDDLYLFDTSGSANNAVLLTSPRIETSFPAGDAAVQFAVGAAILGTSLTRGGKSIPSAAVYAERQHDAKLDFISAQRDKRIGSASPGCLQRQRGGAWIAAERRFDIGRRYQRHGQNTGPDNAAEPHGGHAILARDHVRHRRDEWANRARWPNDRPHGHEHVCLGRARDGAGNHRGNIDPDLGQRHEYRRQLV